jgi:hypothetical protein
VGDFEVANGVEADLADRIDVRGKPFSMVIDGQHYTDRSAAGEALQRHYLEARSRKVGWKAVREERSVGQFAGFDLGLSIPAASDDSPCFVLKGRRAYAAHHSDTPQGMLRVIENVANSLVGRLSDANDDLVRAEKRLADILIELAKPFDKAARLTSLRLRQREINAALDLDKGYAGGMEAEAAV